MPKRIEFEGKVHDFPDDFTDGEIQRALASGGRPQTTTSQPQGSAVGRFFGGLWDTTIGGLKDAAVGTADLISQAMPGGRGFDVNSPGGKMLTGIVQSHIDQAQKAKEAYGQGRYSEAVGHSLATVLPLVGPAAAHAGERIGEGDVAGGLGEATGLLGTVAAPKVVKAVKGKLPASVKVTGPLVESKLNPVEQSAVNFLDERNVPLRVGTKTGNKFVRSAEAVVQHSPLGAEAAEELARGTEQGLRRVAGELADEVRYAPATPESAGASVKKALGKNIERLGIEENEAYSKAWRARNDPAHSAEVPVRVERTYFPNGEIGERTVTKRVNMPVDIREIKAQAKPLVEELQMALSRSDQSQSVAFNALEKILQSDDFIPAWQAERGLGALKTMARTTTESGVRNYSQGTAAGLIHDMQESINAAVAKTGGDALRGLQNGRATHATKMEVAGIADQLRAEPVQAFEQMVWKNDTGIDFLRKIREQAPDIMPEIGRAFVDQLFDKATREGGFAKARGILNQWQNLGAETKQLLFADPTVRANLDKFFKGAEMVGQTPNSSGTALVSHASSMNPFRILAGVAGSKLLYSPRGAALLTEGLRIPLGGSRGAAAESALRRMAGQFAAASRTAAANTDQQ